MDFYSKHTDNEGVRAKYLKLERENKILRRELMQLVDSYKEVINKVPLPILIFSRGGKVEMYNESFISLLDFNGRERENMLGSLQGVDVEELLDEGVYSYLEPFITKGTDVIERDIVINKFSYNLVLHNVRRGNYAIVILRPLVSSEQKYEEMIVRLNSVIDGNLEMMQKIGSLMGEEVSKSTETLSSMINMIKG